jgi:hypothetical protein
MLKVIGIIVAVIVIGVVAVIVSILSDPNTFR